MAENVLTSRDAFGLVCAATDRAPEESTTARVNL